MQSITCTSVCTFVISHYLHSTNGNEAGVKTKAMNRQNIETLIRDLFRQNFNAYPESYPLTDDGLMSEEGTTCAQDNAKRYWAVRTEFEIERDEKAGVTEIDYVEWVMVELSDLIPAAK